MITLCLCVLRTNSDFALALKVWFFITEVQSVYSAVQSESLCNTHTFRLERVNMQSTMVKVFIQCIILLYILFYIYKPH